MRQVVHGVLAPDLRLVHRGDVVDPQHHTGLAAALVVQPATDTSR